MAGTSLPDTPAGDPSSPDRAGFDADRIADAVLAVPGVTRLHAGTFGEVATYLPGRRVAGVRIASKVAEVHVVLAWDSKLLATAEAVRRAVEPLVATPVDVYVEDLDRSVEPAPSGPPALVPSRDPVAPPLPSHPVPSASARSTVRPPVPRPRVSPDAASSTSRRTS